MLANRRTHGWVLTAIGLLCCAAVPSEAADAVKPRVDAAQQRQADAGEDAGEDGSPVSTTFARADRGLRQRLHMARQLLEQERFAEAIDRLDGILDAREDYFLADQREDSSPGLKAEAQRLLGSMPRRGRDLYELQNGSRARKMLEHAVTAGDVNQLAEVSRRFFHTRAGYEATLLLGLDHLDRASPLAGALTLKRLRDVPAAAEQFEPGLSVAIAACWLRAGLPDKAKQVLDDIRERFPRARLLIAGREVALVEAPQALAVASASSGGDLQEAEQWAMFHGNPARNASASGGGPLLSTCWRVPLSEHPHIEAKIDQIDQAHRDQDRWAIPSMHPLVVKDVVLMRTARNLLAVDFLTGKRLWEVPGDDPFEAFSDPTPDTPFVQTHPVDLSIGLRFRMWGDATFGTLSSDGQLVFAVEDLPLDVGISANQFFFMGNRRESPSDPKSFNRLAAYDIRTGKLMWHLGGKAEESGLAEAGTFFLGPPMPLSGQLYAIAELKGEIKLLALEARSGSVLWTQQLAMAEQEGDILQAPLRRVAGVTPSYADGVLVCPTSNRSVVALDLATRSLLWGYPYEDESASPPERAFMGGRQNNVELDPATRWTDSNVMIAEGRVLLTPVDSNQLHCLNLIDGKVVWRKPREENLYLACVHQGKAVLVNRRGVHALNLADGSPAWDSIAFPSGAMASGTGFLSGDSYYVPLNSGEVLAVDVSAGKSGHVYRSRRGAVPGNLVCYKGRIVSQRADAVDVFHQLDSLRKKVEERLATNADDPEALAQRGEIQWDQGNLHEAIASLRRAYELAPGPNHRSVLREALFEGLEADFAAYRGGAAEIERLLDEPKHQAAYLRLVAAGCEGAGEFRKAFEHYLKLIELDEKHREMDTLDKGQKVRRDRWIQVRLTSLREAAPGDVRAEIDRMTRTRLDAAAKVGNAESLQKFLDHFGGQPLGDDARRELAKTFRKSRKFLQAELLLRQLAASSDRSQVAAAVAEIADLLMEARATNDAASCYERLAGEFADVVCREGKTGRQLVESLAADSPVRRALKPAAGWPIGEVVVAKEKRNNQIPPAFTSAVVPFLTERGPFFNDTVIEMHHSPQALVARDGWGNTRWQMQISELMRQERYSMNTAFLRAGAMGHLLLISTGTRIVAIDTLVPEGGSPRMIWREDIDEPGRSTAASRRGRVQLVGGFQRLASYPAENANPNPPLAIGTQLVCLQRYHTLQGLDPGTGEAVWSRDDVRPGSTVFGDDRYVLIIAPEQATAAVVRAADGKLLRTSPVPPSNQRLATVGRFILALRQSDAGVDGGQASLEMLDPSENRSVWPSRKFNADAKVAVIGNEVAGVFEPSGRFVVLDLEDGRTLVDAKLQPERIMSDIHVFRSPEQYLLVVNGVERSNDRAEIYYGVHGVQAVQITRAKVYGFDRQGKGLWPTPAIVEDQFLITSQPTRLPVLLFACGVQERRSNNSVQQRLSIVGVDKRTGRLVRPKESPEGSSSLRLVGDPEKKTVEVQLQREVVTMSFTDQPPSPEGDTKTEKPSKPIGALLKALQRGVPGLPIVPNP